MTLDFVDTGFHFLVIGVLARLVLRVTPLLCRLVTFMPGYVLNTLGMALISTSDVVGVQPPLVAVTTIHA